MYNFVFFAGRHDSSDLKKIAMEKLRTNKEILSDPAFKRKFKGNLAQDIMFDLFKEIL